MERQAPSFREMGQDDECNVRDSMDQSITDDRQMFWDILCTCEAEQKVNKVNDTVTALKHSQTLPRRSSRGYIARPVCLRHSLSSEYSM